VSLPDQEGSLGVQFHFLTACTWTQTLRANGKMLITFDAEFIIKEKSPGWEALQNDPTLHPKVREALELASTLDEVKRLRLMAEIEDEVLPYHWGIRLYDTRAVYAYADRVLAHPMPEFGAHFLDLNRIVLQK
jgi:hypothetical protein